MNLIMVNSMIFLHWWWHKNFTSFSVAYLLGVPIVGYSLDIGKENVNLIDEKVQKRIYEGKLDSKDLDR